MADAVKNPSRVRRPLNCVPFIKCLVQRSRLFCDRVMSIGLQRKFVVACVFVVISVISISFISVRNLQGRYCIRFVMMNLWEAYAGYMDPLLPWSQIAR